jgi:hypothetical protein
MPVVEDFLRLGGVVEMAPSSGCSKLGVLMLALCVKQ